eukprot:Gb_22479 [translate_table: standard]
MPNRNNIIICLKRMTMLDTLFRMTRQHTNNTRTTDFMVASVPHSCNIFHKHGNHLRRNFGCLTLQMLNFDMCFFLQALNIGPRIATCLCHLLPEFTFPLCPIRSNFPFSFLFCLFQSSHFCSSSRRDDVLSLLLCSE